MCIYVTYLCTRICCVCIKEMGTETGIESKEDVKIQRQGKSQPCVGCLRPPVGRRAAGRINAFQVPRKEMYSSWPLPSDSDLYNNK